jgi:hypothetical protein
MKEELIRTLLRVKEIRNEIRDLDKKNSLNNDISYYIDLFHEKLIFTDHGERDKYALPKIDAINKIERMRLISTEKINSNFAQNKTKLLSIVNRYISQLQDELQKPD